MSNYVEPSDAELNRLMIVSDPNGHLVGKPCVLLTCNPMYVIHIWPLRSLTHVYDGMPCKCGLESLRL